MLFKIWYPLKLQFLTNKTVLGGNQSKLGKQGNPAMYLLAKKPKTAFSDRFSSYT